MENTKTILYNADSTDFSKMSISQIASIVSKDWRAQGKGIYFGAKPYLEAMHTMNTVKDNYGLESGRSIVAYFLNNANTYKGETARAIKKELNKRIK
jgi:pantothenate kinase